MDTTTVISIGVQTLPTYCPGRDFGCALFFHQKNHNQSVGQTGNHIFKTLLGIFNMSTSEQQKLFNQYPIKAFVPDIWHGSERGKAQLNDRADILLLTPRRRNYQSAREEAQGRQNGDIRERYARPQSA